MFSLLLFLIALPFLLTAVKERVYVEREMTQDEKILLILYVSLVIIVLFRI